MVRYCCVPQCSTYCTEHRVSFHSFPKDRKLRKLWYVKLRIGKQLPKFAMVCNKHFAAEHFKMVKKDNRGYSRRLLVSQAIPTCNLPVRPHDTARRNRKAPSSRETAPVVPVDNPDQSCPVSEDQHQADKELHPDQEELLSALEELNATVCTPESFRKDASTQSNTYAEEVRPPLTYNLVRTDSQLAALTGIGSLQLMTNIVGEFTEARCKASSRGYSLSDEDVVLMVMIKLYHNISFNFLAVLFGVHRTTVSNLFTEGLTLLAHVLREAVFFPSKESVQNNLPVHFEKFVSTRVVLDCTEVPIEKAKDLQSRILTYSQYKKAHTAKVLIGCAPSGLISFVSESFGGRASDSAITKESGVLNLCTAFEDQVMVDKGFLIDNLCSDANLELIRPPFLKQRKQMSEADALRNNDIARARVHVERAIQRLKIYKILQHKFSVQMLPLFDLVIQVAAGLVNLSKPILASDKFFTQQ